MFEDYIKTLFILTGIQASGKTTFRKKFLSGCVCISLDELKTRKREQAAFEDIINSAKNCAVDNTNTTKEERQKYIAYAKSRGYKIVGLYFRSVLEESFKRNAQRQGKAQVPQTAIRFMAKRLEQPQFTEGFDELFYIRITDGGDFAVSKWSDDL